MRKLFLDYTATLDIVGPEDVQNPENGSFWIQELRLHKGHVCHICGYITTSKAYIEIHANKKHGWIKKQGVQWDLKPVQTFFINNKTRYFIVTQANLQHTRPSAVATVVGGGSGDTIKTLLNEAKRLDDEEKKKLNLIDKEQLPVDLTPWLRRTRWPLYFAGKDLSAIAQIG